MLRGAKIAMLVLVAIMFVFGVRIAANIDQWFVAYPMMALDAFLFAWFFRVWLPYYQRGED